MDGLLDLLFRRLLSTDYTDFRRLGKDKPSEFETGTTEIEEQGAHQLCGFQIMEHLARRRLFLF